MKVLGVNGIYNASWGRDSFTDRILAELHARGRRVHDVAYPWLTWGLAYFDAAKRARAQRIIDAHARGDAVVAHSAGCLLTLWAMRMGARFGAVFFFGAACESNIEIPAGACLRLYNVHSAADRALARGARIPRHEFGRLGLDGYKGKDKRVVNVPAEGLGHHDHVKPGQLCRWSSFVDEAL